MRVLVTAASKYGSTTEIAQAIAGVLSDSGHETTELSAAEVDDVAGYDAVVIGSAIYGDHWMDAAKLLVSANTDALRELPVWLFSSGPIGDPPKPEEDPVDADEMVIATNAREHTVFAGKLDRSKLRFSEKAIVVALRAQDGDFRDFDAIRSWARGIAATLDQTERGE